MHATAHLHFPPRNLMAAFDFFGSVLPARVLCVEASANRWANVHAVVLAHLHLQHAVARGNPLTRGVGVGRDSIDGGTASRRWGTGGEEAGGAAWVNGSERGGRRRPHHVLSEHGVAHGTAEEMTGASSPRRNYWRLSSDFMLEDEL